MLELTKRENNKQNHKPLLLLLALLVLSACSVNKADNDRRFSVADNWLILPIVNFSETPQAGERAERIAETLLRAKGLRNLKQYPSQDNNLGLPILDEQKRFNTALQWAKASNAAFAITGSIEEWRYKSGLDGEPAVGISLQVIDLASTDVVWSASGSRAGWSRESLSGTAHKVLEKLTNKLRIKD